jgi:hypothetical protein
MTDQAASAPNRQISIDAGGVGQSGYTAGRCHDLALETMLQTSPTVLPRGVSDEYLRYELATDDRWAGRGGVSAHA